MTKAERLARARAIRGVCYVPTWARGPQDSLGASCQRETLARELAFIPQIGFNGVRLWLSIHGYEKDPAVYLANLGFFLDRCAELGVDVHLNLFDSVGIDPEDALRPAVRKEQAFGGRAVELQSALGFTNGDATALLTVPDTDVPMVLASEYWIAGPGYHHLEAAEWPRCEAFVRAVAGTFRDHPALVILEVMNEPEIAGFGGREFDHGRIARFYTRMLDVLIEAAPDVPTTIGSTRLANFIETDGETGGRLDIISFHSFNSAAALRSEFEAAAALSASTGGRPVLCSEWGTYPGETDEVQLARFQELVPIALESGAAWEVVHLLAGACNGAMAALCYSNGTMRPSGMYVRGVMREHWATGA